MMLEAKNVHKTFEGTEICHFTGNQPSSGMVTVTGNYSNSKGKVSYAGKTYSVCVKMESSTQVRITPTAPCTVTLIFVEPNSGLTFLKR